MLVQGQLFDKREIGNVAYIVSFLEKVKLAGWKEEDNKFDRNGLIMTWTGFSKSNISKVVTRIAKENEKVLHF